ncbi:flagellar basal body-associated protein FliL [Conyzicola lurida]|uniref:Flagellar basal body-associated protein FliL n=1 Tax=Conyzicola lurida TaxID=1172621 RepID=A0A841ARD5_9MICO|nr:DUF3105 domain-containing protein [Conyzicola lurida]MBB5844502.1 flagellar basal body-associated protein FliL [Conyzicola lurida]
MASNNPANPSVKEQREAKRAAKVAVLKKQQAKEKRNRRIAIIIGSVAAVAVVALIISFVVVTAKPDVDPDDIAISGIETFDDLPNTHVTTAVDYEATYGATPPAGGNHAGAWLNCGVYSEEQQNENAVHSLEHGAVWVTYDPEALSESEVQTLRDAMPSTYTILSPYPGLPAPVVASGWGVQVQLDGVDDPRLADFITKYRQADTVPEPGAVCTGAIDGPGRVS